MKWPNIPIARLRTKLKTLIVESDSISSYFGVMLFDLQPSDRRPYSVTEITRMVKQSLESAYPNVWVVGEVSNCRRHSSGHWYFTLKDENAQLAAVLWRSRAAIVSVLPEDGMKAQVRGALTVYAPRGVYQIEVLQLLPVGLGELQVAFEKLKRKLAAEGLFDQSRKKPLPQFPQRIGLVTSPTGAAIQDVRSVLSRRFPSLEVIVAPVRVQGPGAADEIAGAIRDMNAFGGVDVLIVGRGGGSLEDLWAFNEEIVARAIAESDIPVISAVGHEIDYSIADFVADLRAPTPSAAAELVIRDRTELVDILSNICYTLKERIQDRIDFLGDRIQRLITSYTFNRPRDLLRQYVQRLDELDRSLLLSTGHALESAVNRHISLHQQLEALSPQNVLRRGYALVRKDGRIVTRARELGEGEGAEIQFLDDRVKVRVGR
ncbi:MAG: exodeoxyribonuclease 7 large subunit [Bacteroidia bacterium]|nr:MAG: exodeoxyribonuclease 7 large subunit [Bacteroidia bacterium]